MQGTKGRCDVTFQAISNRPSRICCRGTSDVSQLIQVLSWRCIQIIFRDSPVPSESVCQGWHYSRTGRGWLEPQTRTYDRNRTCPRTVDKDTALRISVSWKIPWGPICRRDYPPDPQNPLTLEGWALARDFKRLSAASRASLLPPRNMPLTEGIEKRWPTEATW